MTGSSSAVRPQRRPSGAAGFVSWLGSWRDESGGLAHALAAAVRDAVLDGRLPAGSRLPSERALAVALSVSRGTVVTALTRLRDDGWVTTQHGGGSVIHLPDRFTRRTAAWSVDRGGRAGTDLDLTEAVTAAPHAAYLVAMARAVEASPGLLLGSGTATPGLPRLRELVAGRYTREGLATRPEQILITAGAQAALALLVAHLHEDAHRPVLVENATFPGALAILGRNRARLVTVPVDAVSGWDVEQLASVLRGSAARLAYLVPDFHNPTGAVMDAATRASIAALTASTGLTVVADETMRDLDLRRPPRPVPHLAGPGVVQIGSTSKTIWSGLRVGWIRARTELVRQLCHHPLQGPLSPSPLDQQIAIELLGDSLTAVLHERRGQLRAQRDHLAALLAGTGWDFTLPDGGLSLWLHLGADSRARTVARTAARHGLALTPGPVFAADRTTLVHHLRLPFTATPDLLTCAVDRLHAALAGHDATRRT